MITPAFFDVETGPLPLAQIEAMMPEFEAPGNYKDPEKIKANIETQKAQWRKDAALSPFTGQVLVIGILEGDDFLYLEGMDERERLTGFWQWCVEHMGTRRNIIGWCSHGFDLPYLVKRSCALSVPRPISLRTGDNRYWHESFVDLQKLWQMGEFHGEGTLDQLARFLGLGAKTGNGADFAQLWESDKTAAFAYLENDLRITKAIYERVTETL